MPIIDYTLLPITNYFYDTYYIFLLLQNTTKK